MFSPSQPEIMTDEKIKKFDQDGYLVIKDFIPRQQCRQLIERADQLLAGFDADAHRSVFSTDNQARDRYFLDSGDRIRFFFEADAFDRDGRLRQTKAQSINKIGHALHELDPVFRDFSRQPAIARLVHHLGLQDPRLLQSMYIFKQPRIGGEVMLHQDATFLFTHPISALGLWFALEDADETNGCLQVLPGGHRLGLKQRYIRNGDRTHFETLDASPFPDTPLRCLPATAGTIVLLHGLLPHYSAANRSHRSRQAYTLHCIDGNTHYPADNWLQRATPPPSLPSTPE